jgi:hypothetical protein
VERNFPAADGLRMRACAGRFIVKVTIADLRKPPFCLLSHDALLEIVTASPIHPPPPLPPMSAADDAGGWRDDCMITRPLPASTANASEGRSYTAGALALLYVYYLLGSTSKR